MRLTSWLSEFVTRRVRNNSVTRFKKRTRKQIGQRLEWLEDRALLAVDLSVNFSTGTEAAGTVVTVTATNNTGNVASDQTVDLAITGSDITVGDYSLSASQITILSGASSGSVTFTILNDSVVELTETATLTISNPSSGITLGLTTSQNVSITDNDKANLSINSRTLSENGTFTFTITSDKAASRDMTVLVNTADGTATLAGLDYTQISNQTATITAGSTSTTVTVTVNDDSIVESDEQFTLGLSNSQFNGVTDATRVGVSGATGTATITNNDIANLSINDISVNENGTFTFTITSDKVGSSNMTVVVNTANGSAIAGTDYTQISNQTATITAGSLSTTVTVTVNNDAIVENNETFTLGLSGERFAGAVDSTRVAISDNSGTATIQNDDTASLSINDISIAENGTFTFTISSDKVASQNMTVLVNTADGTATLGGSDYTQITNQTATITAGNTTTTVTVTVNNDTIVEPNETFSLGLSNAQFNGVTDATRVGIGDNSGTATVQNNDTASISIGDVTANENGTFTFTITSSRPSSQDLTGTINTASGTATSGTDFTAISSGTFTITGNGSATTTTVTVTVSDDTKVEGSENFNVNLTSPLYGGAVDGTRATISDGTGVGTITDNDTAVITFTNPSTSISEGGTSTTFNVTLTITANGTPNTGTLDRAVSFDVSTVGGGTATGGGVDYTFSTQSYSFPIGTASNSTSVVNLGINEDLKNEGSETANFGFSNFVSGAGSQVTTSGTQTVTITDNDSATAVVFNAPTGGAGTDAFRIVLNGANLEFYDNAVLIDSRAFATITSLTINGADGEDDSLNVDMSTGNVIPSGGVTFDGGTGNDSLTVTGNNSTVVYSPNGVTATKEDGAIVVDGGTITFDEIEDNTISILGAANLTINFAGGDANIDFTSLSNVSTQVSGNSFVTTNFNNPSQSLTINFTDNNNYDVDVIDLATNFNPNNGVAINGGGGVEDFTITDLGDSFTGALTIDLAGGTDSVVFTTNDQTPSSLSITSETITATTATLTVSGATTLNAGATGTITLTDVDNDFGGNVSITNANTASIDDTTGIAFVAVTTQSDLTVDAGGNVAFNGATNVGGNLDVQANANGGSGSISGSGAIVVTGTTTLETGSPGTAANDITLTTAANNFSTVIVTSANDVNLRDTNAIELGSSTANATFQVTAGGTITQSGVVSATTLTTSSVGGTNLSTSTNTVTGFNATNTTSGNISLKNTTGTLTVTGVSQAGGGNLTVWNDGALTISGAVTVAGGGNITLAADGNTAAHDVAVNADVSATGGNGNIFLYAGDTITLAGIADVTTAGTGAVLLSAGTDYNNGGALLDGTNAGVITMTSGATVQSQDGDITLLAPGNLALSILNANSDVDGTLGDVIVTADYDGPGGTLSNGVGAISDNLAAETANITGDQIALRAGTGIGDGVAPDNNDLNLAVVTLAAVTESGDINVQDLSGGLSIDAFNGLSGVTITDAVNNNSGNDHITIRTSSPLTVAVGNPVVDNDGGNIVLAAEGTAGTDDLTINANVTATGGNGTISLYAGDTISLGAAAVVVSAANNGTILLSAGTNYNNGAPANGTNAGNVSMTNGSTVQSEDAGITLLAPGSVVLSIVNANSDADATLGNVTVTADYAGVGGTLSNSVGAISDNLTAETANITGDTATLTAATGIGSLTSLATDIDTAIVTLVATNTTSGDIIVRESNTLVVDGTGVRTLGGNGNINLYVDAGSLTFNNVLTTNGTGDTRLVVATSVTQLSTGVITTDQLGIRAGTNVTLSTATTNDVNDLAVSTTGVIEFRDGDDLTITTVAVDSTGAFAATSGLVSTGNDINLRTGTTLAVNQVITAGAGDVRIVAGNSGTTSITQDTSGVITADELGIQATRNVGLAAAQSDVNTIAVAATNGTIDFIDSDNLIVGTVAAGGTNGFTGATGITSGGNDVYLETNGAGGTLVINSAINTGAGDLRLEASAEVTQTAAISATGLSLTDTGPFTLTLATNSVTTLAANSNSTINYVNAGSLEIGAVSILTTSINAGPGVPVTTTGITTSSADVRLKASVGSFTITDNINLNSGGAGGAGGSLELTATTGATQVGSIKALGLALRGVGLAIDTNRYILRNDTIATANDVARIAGLMTNGHVEFVDLNNLDVDDVTVTTGIALSPTAVSVMTTGIAVGNPNPSVDVDTNPDPLAVQGGGDVRLRAGITFANAILTANSILDVTVANPISTQSNPADFTNVNGGDVLIGGGVELNAALTLGSGDIDLSGSGADICIDTATVITLAPPGSTATLQPIGNIIVMAPLSTIGGDLTLNADADNNGTGGVWVLNGAVLFGSIDVDGALFVYGSELTLSSCGTPAVSTVGIRIDQTGAGIEINANSSIVLETKTNAVAGGSNDDVELNGYVHSDGAGSISIAAENRIVQSGTSIVSLGSSGSIYYQANDMLIDTASVLPSLIDAGAGGIVHLRNRTATLPINVGTTASTGVGVVATTLGLSNAELNRIAAVSVVRIGFDTLLFGSSSPFTPNVLTNAGSAGTITITAANINVLNSTVLHLITGANIVDDGIGGVGTITETNLALEAVTGIDLDNVNAVPGVSGNDVDNLAIRLTGGAAANDGTFKDVDDLNFAIVDSVVTPEAVNVVGDLTIIAGGAVTQSAAIITGGLELIDLFNDPNPPLTFLAFPNYYLPNSSNRIARLEAYSQRSVNITDSVALAVDVVANNFRTFPVSGASGIWVQSLQLTAPTVTVNSPIETNDELGFVTFDVTTLLDINANIFSRGKIEQIGTATSGVTVADVELRTTDDNITFLGGVMLDGASLVTPTTMSTDANWTTPFTGIPLAANAAATTGGGNVVFNSTLRSNPSGDTAAAYRGNDLTLETGTGNIQFIGQVGGASGGAGRLGVVNIVDAHDVTASTGFSANAIYQQAGDGETAFNGFVQTNGRRDVLAPDALLPIVTNYGVDITTKMITLNAAMQTTSAPGSTASAAIRLNNSGTLSIVAGAGSINSDGAVSQVGTGNNLVGGDIVTTNDNISFASDTYLSGSPIQINSQNADVSFAARFQINNKTVTIRDKDFVDLGTVTAIAGGILNVFVANTATRGSIQADSGETITGAGTMNTDVSVLTGGTLAPAMDASGLGTGILTVNGNVVLAANAVYAVDLNGTVAGSSYDQVVTGATFKFTATGAILSATRPVTFNPATGSVLTIIDGSVDVVGNFANAADGTYVYINGLYFRVNYDVTAGDLTLTRLDPPGAAVTIIDDNGSSPGTPVAGFTLSPNNTTAWSPNSVAGRGYANDLRFASPGTGSSTALYTFSGLVAGHTYRVSTTWFPHINRATDSPFTVDDGAGGTAAVTTTINQRNSPDDFTSGGSAWEDLVVGGYTISSTTLTVLLTNNTSTGYVIADAVRIEDVTGAAPEIVVMDGATDIADGTGVVDFGTTTVPGADISKTISIKNTGLSPLVLSSATITPPAGFSISGYTPQTIAPGAMGIPFTITLSHLVAGNFSGQISFNTNDFDENPFNFTIKGGVTTGATLIADNLAAGTGYNTIAGAANNAGTNLMYGEVGLWHNNDDSQVGYQQDLRYASANSNSQASWTFSGLATGTYRVSVTFRAESNRASNASFTVTGTGVASPTTIQINQRVAPNQFQDANVYWIDLAPAFGTISAGGTITVTLDALGSNGFVIADAVRVEFLHPLQAAEGPAANPTATVLTAADLDATAAAAVARWQQASLTAAQQAALNGIAFAITELPDAYLGSETDETIFIDPNAAGYGWYVDSTPYDDAEFGLTIASTELGATDPVAADGMDLLTVLMHEIGHRLGLDDVALTEDAHGLMTESIDVGTRRLPVVAAVSEGDVEDASDDSSDTVDNDVSDQVFYTFDAANKPAPTTVIPTIAIGGTSGAAHVYQHGSGHSAGGENGGQRHHRTGGKPHDEGTNGSRSLLGALFNFVRNRK